MGVPTEREIKQVLEGYGLTKDVISDDWIQQRRDNFIIPWIEKKTRLSFISEKEYTEYLSGTGKNILILSRKPVNSLVSLTYVSGLETVSNLASGMELAGEDGIIIKRAINIEGNYISIFPKGNKNIKVTYKYGFNDFLDPATSTTLNDIKEAIKFMVAKQILIQIGARTGGGNVSTQAWSRDFGPRGKYTDIINNLDSMAYEILSNYWTGVVGT